MSSSMAKIGGREGQGGIRQDSTATIEVRGAGLWAVGVDPAVVSQAFCTSYSHIVPDRE